MRWLRRILLGLIAFVMVAILAVLAFLHTDYGRGVARKQIEARMNAAFTGGAHVGALEGSVLGEMVLRDVVINAADKKPAITVKKLTLGVGILPLFSKQARVASLRAEDVDIDATRLDGLLKPTTEKTGWAVGIPKLRVDRAHVKVDEQTDIDNIYITGDIDMPTNGPLDADVLVSAWYRQKNAPIWLDTQLRNTDEVVSVPSLIARVGDVRLVGAGLQMTKPIAVTLATPRARPPVVTGLLSVTATKQAIAQLVDVGDLPIDKIDLSVVAKRNAVALQGKVDETEIHGNVEFDLEAKQANGFLATTMLDLTKLSQGKVQGRAATFTTFDGSYADKPSGNAVVQASGDVAGFRGAATIALAGNADRISGIVFGRAPGAVAQIGATVYRGKGWVLEASRVIAKVNPGRVDRRSPVQGMLDVDLRASGALSPKPDLAIAGKVAGQKLRAKDTTIESLKLAIDARHLPEKPFGRAELHAQNVVRGTIRLSKVEVNAANRDDGKIAATLRTTPESAPWLLETDTLITTGDTVTIDLVRHRVHANNGADWTGTTGRLTIAPDRIELRDFASASSDGKLAASGSFQRRSGDITAHADLAGFLLENIDRKYKGVVDGKVDVTRTRGKLAGVVDVVAKGVAIDPRTPTFDAKTRVEAKSDQLLVAADATAKGLGEVKLDVDIDAPKDITNVARWKHMHRDTIRSARLQLVHIDAAKLAEMMKAQGAYTGTIEGDIQISPTVTGGLLQLKAIEGPALKNLGPLSANLTIAQLGPDEIQPTLVATIDDREAAGTSVQKPLAKLDAQARFAIPEHLFDPTAWHALGKGAFKGGSVRVEDVIVEPALLERLQVSTNLRGRASFVAELAPAMASAKVSLGVKQLRGDPIAEPVTLDLNADIDNVATTATLSIKSKLPLLDAKARVPVSLQALLANPSAMKTAKLEATATIPDASAPAFLGTFGRTQVIAGKLSGTIDVAGTIAKPTVRARLAGTDLKVPPGPRGKPIKVVKRLSIDGKWDGDAGTLAVDATEEGGSLSLLAHGSPKHLEQGGVTLVAKDFDLVPLLAFAPGPAGGGAGRINGKLDLVGLEPKTAKLVGELHVTDARLPVAPMVGTLRRAKLDLVVTDREIKIAVDGRLGPGTVKMDASIALDGAQPKSGEATITLRKISPIGVVEPSISADATAKLHREPHAWVADIVIKHGVVKVPDARGDALAPVGMPDDMMWTTQRRKMEKAGERPERPSLIANIDLRSTYVESTEIRGYIHGKMKIEADANNVGMIGKIEAERGDLDLFGRRYQLDRALARFDGTTDPMLDILITHDFPEVTTRTEVHGRLSKPDLRLSSDPGVYSQGQLLGFLLGGEPQGQPADGNPRDKAASAGASIVANKIGGYVKDALPIDIDVLRYEAATSTSGAAITIGSWITRSLFVAYRQRIEAKPDENTGEGEVEYWLTHRFVVEGVVGDRGHNGVDLLWRKRY